MADVRIDTYLWSIRIFKTRTQASNAIAAGKVKLNGNDFKASHSVRIGEVYSVKTPEKRQSIQVASIISKRLQYSEAILHYFDVSTEEEKEYLKNKMSSSFYTGKRLSKQGRPTKKNARDINDFYDSDNQPNSDE
jgi:ribosome-associated heat shock protein Hsp15